MKEVDEVTGKDYRWFFDETWRSSNLVDYSVEVKNRKARRLQGYVERSNGELSLAPGKPDDPAGWESEVVVRRLGGARMPIELLVEFGDGRSVRETWDGQYRWKRFQYAGNAKVARASVDPDGKIALDANPSNNVWLDEEGVSRRAAFKWAARYLFWLQNLLELHTVLG